MADRVTAIVSRAREVNMFGELSHGHLVLLENAAEERDGHLYESMSCIIVAAFKFEAFLNHIGSHIFPFWSELERLSHRNKLSAIATHLEVSVEYGKRPYQELL